MPRRNVRPRPGPISEPPITRESLQIAKPLAERKADHEDMQRRRYREHDHAEKCALLAMDQCAWPGCEVEPQRGADPLPVCMNHAIRIYGRVDKLNDHPSLTEYQLNRRLQSRTERQREEAEQESRAIAQGWIYYIRVTDRIKVGYSADVKRRMRAYPPHAELLAVHPGTPTLEREMHAKLAGHLAQGREWFRPDPEVMAHINLVLDQFGPPPKSMVYTFREGTPSANQASRPQ